MAFQSKDLSVLSYANGFTMWHYTSVDLDTDVDTSGYFDAASNMLRVGDFIMANLDTDGTPTHGVLVVTSNTGGVVDCANLTNFASSDTD